jgi:hypothetical protein
LKHLFPALSLLLFVTVAEAQSPAHADTGHRFLWFTGHWSTTKKNSFIITGTGGGGLPTSGGTGPGENPPGGSVTPPPQGGSVTISGDGSVLISGTGIDAWNRRLDRAIQSQQQYVQQLDNPQDNLDPATHQLHELLKPDAQQQLQETQDLRIDKQQDILSPNTKPGQSAAPAAAQSSSSPSSSQDIGEYCRQAKADYDQVISWWKTHAKDKEADLTYPPPPTFDYNCYACDSSIRNNCQQTIDNYVRDFFHPEDSLVAKALGILKFMGQHGIESGKGMDEQTYEKFFAANSKDPSQSGACSYLSPDNLAGAALDITRHAYARADKMMRDNRKNFKAVSAIVKTWLTAARNYMLISGNQGFEDRGMTDLGSIVSRAVEYYTDEFRRNDWRQIGNLTYILEMMRQQALLGFNNDATFQDYLGRLERIWNGFKLTIEMDIKIGKDGGYRLTHIKGEGYIMPAFQRDSNQCYKWVMADENSMDCLGFYKPSVLQTIDCHIIDNEIVMPPQVPKMTYVGTRTYKTTLQDLNMNFCNPGHDTIMLSGFTPSPLTAGTWQVPYSSPVNLGVNGMEQFFEDANAKKKLVDDGEAQKASDAMQKQAEQLKTQMEALKSQMTGPQGGASYEKMMELANKARSLATSAGVGKMLWLDFILPVQNNTTVLVDKKFDAKEMNPQESPIIVYGYYTIHIENTGNGKAKTPPKK